MLLAFIRNMKKCQWPNLTRYAWVHCPRSVGSIKYHRDTFSLINQIYAFGTQKIHAETNHLLNAKTQEDAWGETRPLQKSKKAVMNKHGTRRRQIHRRVSELLMQWADASTSTRRNRYSRHPLNQEKRCRWRDAENDQPYDDSPPERWVDTNHHHRYSTRTSKRSQDSVI